VAIAPLVLLERREWAPQCTQPRQAIALKGVWKDGARAIALEPPDWIVRLCAAVPARRSARAAPASRAVLRHLGRLRCLVVAGDSGPASTHVLV
jgi:hypothetical protein